MNFFNKFIQTVLIIGLSTTIFGTDAPPKNCVDERVLDLFTKWRQGNLLTLPLPSLNTTRLDSYDGQYSGYGIKVVFSTGEMNMTGLSNFIVKELSANTDDLLAVSGTMNVPSLSLMSDKYNLKGSAYVFYSLKGTGFMNVTFENVNLMYAVSLAPSTNNEGIQVKDIQLNYSIDAIHVNLANCSWPVNKVLNAEGLNIMQGYHSFLVTAATEGLKMSLDYYLGSVAPTDLKEAFNC